MHNKICGLLESLGIDVEFMEYEGNSLEYIIFNIYDDEDNDFNDDENDSEVFYINIVYWFKSKTNINKYRKIKKLMKENNFIYDGGKDLKDDGYFGKSLDFIYIHDKQNTEEEI